jgi:hypothetical protein
MQPRVMTLQLCPLCIECLPQPHCLFTQRSKCCLGFSLAGGGGQRWT